MSYLDETGLAYFWGKIKAWANSVFALLGHTHPASDVTLMTGYSKPSSGSAIAASDTLNQAVGKLEAKVDVALDDSNYVHKTGAETVGGQKTFVSDLILGNHDARAPSNDTYCCFAGGAGESYDKGAGLFVYGKDFINADSSDAQSGAFLLRSTTGSTHYDLFGNKSGLLTWRGNSIWAGITNTGSGNAVTSITVGSNNAVTVAKGSTFLTALTNVSEMGRYIDFHYDNATAAYNYDVRLGCSSQGTSAGGGNLTITANAVYVPNPASDANDTRVATTSWVNSNCVKLSGDQTVGGEKKFINHINMLSETGSANSRYIYLQNGSLTAGGSVSSNWWTGVQAVDKNGNFIAGSRFIYYTSGDARVEFDTYQSTTGGVGYSVGMFFPTTSNGTSLGSSSKKWKEVWCTQNSMNSTSDERVKDNISSIPDNVLDAWEDINFIQFKFKDAIQEKGNNARFHNGLIAQRIDEVFKNHNIDISKYGLFLYDEWEAEEAVYDDNGKLIDKAVPAGNSYGLRYVEALCMEAAYMRRENVRLKKRVSDLEDRLAALELRLGSE